MLYNVKASIAVKDPLEVRSAYEALANGLSALCEKVVKLGNSYLAVCNGSTLVKALLQMELQKYDVVIEAQSNNPSGIVDFFEKLSSIMRTQGFPIVLRML